MVNATLLFTNATSECTQKTDLTSFEHFKQIYNTEKKNNNHVFGFNANIQGLLQTNIQITSEFPRHSQTNPAMLFGRHHRNEFWGKKNMYIEFRQYTRKRIMKSDVIFFSFEI